jgi:hypothetical protein
MTLGNMQGLNVRTRNVLYPRSSLRVMIHHRSNYISRDIPDLSRQQFVWSHIVFPEQSRARLVMIPTIASIIMFGSALLPPAQADTYTFK